MQRYDAGKVLGAVLLMLRCTLPHPSMERPVEHESTGIVLSSIGYAAEKRERKNWWANKLNMSQKREQLSINLVGRKRSTVEGEKNYFPGWPRRFTHSNAKYVNVENEGKKRVTEGLDLLNVIVGVRIDGPVEAVELIIDETDICNV